ncbi:MAG: MFS transporter [Dehalococcoidia bacterium]
MGIFVGPIREELGWPATIISVGFVLGTFTGALFQWVLGGMYDKYGARWMNMTAGFVVSLAMVGLGFMTQAWHFWLFFAAARGFAAAGSQLGTIVAIASWFVKKRGRNVGFVGMAQRGGQAVLPLPLLGIMLLFSWREAFFALALLAILMATIPSALFMRRRPEDYGLLPDGEAAAADEEETKRRSESAEVIWTLPEAKRTPTLWLLMIAQAGVTLSLNSVNLFVTDNFIESGIPAGRAILAVTIFAGVSVVAMMGWSFLIERTHTRYVAIAVTALFACAMFFAYTADSFPLVLAFSVLYGLGLGGWTPVSRMLFANYFGRRHFGAIRGFAAPLMVVANPIGPVLAGVIRDTTGAYDLAFVMFAGIFVLSFVMFSLSVPPKKKASSDAV